MLILRLLLLLQMDLQHLKFMTAKISFQTKTKIETKKRKKQKYKCFVSTLLRCCSKYVCAVFVYLSYSNEKNIRISYAYNKNIFHKSVYLYLGSILFCFFGFIGIYMFSANGSSSSLGCQFKILYQFACEILFSLIYRTISWIRIKLIFFLTLSHTHTPSYYTCLCVISTSLAPVGITVFPSVQFEFFFFFLPTNCFQCKFIAARAYFF